MDHYQASDDTCTVFLSSYGVLGAKACVLAAVEQCVTLSFDRWEFPALEVGSKVTLSFVFSNSTGSVLYTPAIVRRRTLEGDHVVFDVEVDADDSSAQTAVQKLEGLIVEELPELRMGSAEH